MISSLNKTEQNRQFARLRNQKGGMAGTRNSPELEKLRDQHQGMFNIQSNIGLKHQESMDEPRLKNLSDNK